MSIHIVQTLTPAGYTEREMKASYDFPVKNMTIVTLVMEHWRTEG